MNFTKMHGLGNDYVYVNGFKEQIDDPVALAQLISDRHTGVGSDGLILILPLMLVLSLALILAYGFRWLRLCGVSITHAVNDHNSQHYKDYR